MVLASRDFYQKALERKDDDICNAIARVIIQLGKEEKMDWLVNGAPDQLLIFDYMV
jgi:hypothetical protein